MIVTAWLSHELIGIALATRFMASRRVLSAGFPSSSCTAATGTKVSRNAPDGRLAFSDYYAWGLVSENPFAVRVLEKSTRCHCDPRRSHQLLGRVQLGRRLHESTRQVFGRLRGTEIGQHHHISGDYLDFYAAEMTCAGQPSKGQWGAA